VEGSYIATEYFIEKGYRRIACLTAFPGAIPVQDRLKGYQNALDDYNIPFDRSLIKRGDDMSRDGFTELSGYQAMQKILKLDPLPEACVCASDIKAIGAIKAMEEAGTKIPMISYDNLTIAEYIGLSTVHQPIYDMGSKATESLIKRIEDSSREPVKTLYKPELVIRSSSEINIDSEKIIES